MNSMAKTFREENASGNQGGISYYWSVNNSYELLNKISDIKIARSIKTFHFSTLYTNLPLDIIYDSLRSLIIKMFVNSKRVSIMVNPNRKKHSGRMGQIMLVIENTQLINCLKP